jgi:hypothetical protein
MDLSNLFLEPVPLALYITASLYLLLGFLAFRQRSRGAVTADYLMWMLFAMTWWSYSYGMEIHVDGLEDKLFWGNLEYPAIVAVPLFWLFFVLEYTGQSRLLTRRNKFLASIIPVLTVLLMWTNGHHGLMYAESHVELVGDLNLLVINHG